MKSKQNKKLSKAKCRQAKKALRKVGKALNSLIEVLKILDSKNTDDLDFLRISIFINASQELAMMAHDELGSLLYHGCD